MRSILSEKQEFLGALMVVVTTEGLVRADDREGRSATGDCERDSNEYEDFSHGRILSKNYLELYHTLANGCDRNDKKLRRKFFEDEPSRRSAAKLPDLLRRA
jgi:hypothetical protein